MVAIVLNGMNNKLQPMGLPEGMAAIAVNCLFTDTGEIVFPRSGKVSQYAGDTHSLYNNLFVEAGNLKRLNDDNTATVLKTSVGNSRVYYATVGSYTYWANEIAQGKIDADGVNSDWGVAQPPRNPDCTPITYGGMFEGTYRVAIIWLGYENEKGGTEISEVVSVPAGGGIHLTNFPTPPASVTGVVINISSLNGEDMYVYGEYDSTVSDVTLVKRQYTTDMTTMHMRPPEPTGKIVAHGGRMFYGAGNKVYRTVPHKYGLQVSYEYWKFDSDVRVIISAPPVMYVNTNTQLYKIANIDAPDGSPEVLIELDKGSAAIGSECSDPDGVTHYFMSDNGFIACTAEGRTQLSFDNVAIPFFEEGCSTVTESDGIRTLTFVGKGASVNPLANAEYRAAESARGTL